jgi:hypothetical protein
VNGNLPVLLGILFVAGVLILVMRWVFAPSRPPRVSVPGDATPSLLVPVATGLTRAEALSLRAVLGDSNIRSSMSMRRTGRLDVLVFRDDEIRARAVLPPGTPGVAPPA